MSVDDHPAGAAFVCTTSLLDAELARVAASVTDTADKSAVVDNAASPPLAAMPTYTEECIGMISVPRRDHVVPSPDAKAVIIEPRRSSFNQTRAPLLAPG